MQTSQFLVCPPDHYGVVYEINPYMHTAIRVDQDDAKRQWEAFTDVLVSAGASLVRQTPVAGLPDMVFTANAAYVSGGAGLVSRFKYAERAGESVHVPAALAAAGIASRSLPTAAGAFEGAGDVVPLGDTLLLGHGIRSSQAAAPFLHAFAGKRVVPLRLVDPHFYHLDLVVCPLDQSHALVYPGALDDDSWTRLRTLVPHPIVLSRAEALSFCANSVVIGRAVLMHRIPNRLGRLLERLGFTPVEVPVTEFLKGGGSVRCLSLSLAG
ncbi:MAG TPA: amidinotransferase [Candidatus Dormibacteraeota bacterium]